MPKDTIRLSLRDMFHMLENKQCVWVMLSETLIKKFESILAKNDVPQEYRDLFDDYIEYLQGLRTAGKEAEVLIEETKELVYAKLDGDEKYFDGNVIQQKMKDNAQDNAQENASLPS